jgi:hypothetical protein
VPLVLNVVRILIGVRDPGQVVPSGILSPQLLSFVATGSARGQRSQSICFNMLRPRCRDSAGVLGLESAGFLGAHRFFRCGIRLRLRRGTQFPGVRKQRSGKCVHSVHLRHIECRCREPLPVVNYGRMGRHPRARG